MEASDWYNYFYWFATYQHKGVERYRKGSNTAKLINRVRSQQLWPSIPYVSHEDAHTTISKKPSSSTYWRLPAPSNRWAMYVGLHIIITKPNMPNLHQFHGEIQSEDQVRGPRMPLNIGFWYNDFNLKLLQGPRGPMLRGLGGSNGRPSRIGAGIHHSTLLRQSEEETEEGETLFAREEGRGLIRATESKWDVCIVEI